MAFSEQLKILITGDVTSFSRAARQASADTDKMGRSVVKSKRSFADFGKAAALGLAGVGVVAVAMGVDFVKAAEESNKVTKQTTAVLKSMGVSASTSADRIAKLSEKLSFKSGIDDEVIQSGQNVLLTFRSLAQSAGQTGGNFDKATQATLDMSVALGKDMTSSALLVGKALNDPIRGITALRRSGIQFTAQQEEQIKMMVAVGDIAGAQGIILEELGRQFGGSAEAQATASGKLAVAWDNLRETIGEKLLPVVQKFTDWAINTGIPALESMIDFVDRNRTAFIVLAAVVGGVLVTAFTAWAVSVIAATWPILAIGAAVGLVAFLVVKHFDTIKNAFMTAFNWVKNNWPLILAILTGPIGLAVLAIVKHWDAIKRGISALKDWIARTASGMWEGLKSGLKAVVNWIIRRLNEILNAIDVAAGPFINIPSIPQIGSSSGGGGGVSYKRAPKAMAEGGIVTRPTLAMIGEAGPEAVLPLGRGGGVVGTTVINNISFAGAVIGSEQEAARWVTKALRTAGESGRPITVRGRRL